VPADKLLDLRTRESARELLPELGDVVGGEVAEVRRASLRA
jgi:hypothetical protein